MPYFIEIPLRDGDSILVEMSENESGLAPVGRRTNDVIERLPESFTASLARVRSFTAEVLDQVGRYPRQPDRVAIEFGLKFSAKAGLVIAEAGGEASLKFVAEWARGTLEADPLAGDDDDADDGDARSDTDGNGDVAEQ
ncbi:CU044_2847 family protein [Actinomadura sp. WMMA1423]|uniref:CU044_2847 family protein n=1 Tax=Actinomadura sp. WMMA1423 TaxID=2591108 RepID=UPI0011464019|nr:CU044_2847 family protein [Actinomadura sp. WMMA1423]